MTALPASGELATLEAVIQRGLSTFVEVGTALMRIRDERLYRDSHRTFEAYCRERWDWGRKYANRQIQSAELVSRMTPYGVKPTNEAQARELVPLMGHPEEAAEVLKEVRAKHGESASAPKIREAVKHHRPENGTHADLRRVPRRPVAWQFEQAVRGIELAVEHLAPFAGKLKPEECRPFARRLRKARTEATRIITSLERGTE